MWFLLHIIVIGQNPLFLLTLKLLTPTSIKSSMFYNKIKSFNTDLRFNKFAQPLEGRKLMLRFRKEYEGSFIAPCKSLKGSYSPK